MTTSAAAPEPRPTASLAPVPDHPDDTADHPEPAPDPPQPPPATPDQQSTDPQPLDLGTPVGQLAAGAVVVVLLGGWLLYRAGGWTWVLIGGGLLLALALLVAFTPFIWRRLRGGTTGGRSRGSPGLGKLFGRSPGRTSGSGTGRTRGHGRGASPGSMLRSLGLGLPDRKRRKGSESPKGGGSSGGGLLSRARRTAAALFGRRPKTPGTGGGSGRSAAKGSPGPIRRAAAATGRAIRRAASAVRAAPARAARGAAAAGRRAAKTIRAGLTRAAQPFRRVAAFARSARQRDQSFTQALADAARSWWRRLRHKAGPQTDSLPPGDRPADDTATTSAPGTPPTPPTPTFTTASPRTATALAEGRAMTEFALVTHSTELPTIAATYESEDMMDVRGHMQTLREVPLAMGAAVRIWTERLGADYPLNQDAADALQQVYDAVGAVVLACDEASVVFEGSHEADIQRRLQPRTNEHKWNSQ